VPRWETARRLGERVLIAWSGAREAARAVHDALPLLQIAKVVDIIHVGVGAESKGDGPLALSALAGHLDRHGVHVEEPSVLDQPGDIGGAILGAAQRLSVDLVAMGGYGHARLDERILGGVTRAMFKQTHVALVMAH
jgi:nucleotide-binding universal stress UspA family protein